MSGSNVRIGKKTRPSALRSSSSRDSSQRVKIDPKPKVVDLSLNKVRKSALKEQQAEAKNKKKKAEEQRKDKEEKAKADAKKKKADQQRKEKEEKAKADEKKADQQRKEKEEKAKADEKKKADQQRKEKEEKAKADEKKKADQQRKEKEEKAKADEKKKADQQRKDKEEKAKADEKKKADQQRKEKEEKAKKADEKKEADQQRKEKEEKAKADEKKKADQQRKEKEEKAKKADEKKKAEQQRQEKEEKAKKADEKQKEIAEQQRKEKEKGRKEDSEVQSQLEAAANSKMNSKITFVPAKRRDVEHIFKTPEEKIKRAASLSSRETTSSTRQKVRQLEDMLEKSEKEEDSESGEEEKAEEEERMQEGEEEEDPEVDDEESCQDEESAELEDDDEEAELQEEGEDMEEASDESDENAEDEDEEESEGKESEEQEDEDEKDDEKAPHDLVAVAKECKAKAGAIKNSFLLEINHVLFSVLFWGTQKIAKNDTWGLFVFVGFKKKQDEVSQTKKSGISSSAPKSAFACTTTFSRIGWNSLMFGWIVENHGTSANSTANVSKSTRIKVRRGGLLWRVAIWNNRCQRRSIAHSSNHEWRVAYIMMTMISLMMKKNFVWHRASICFVCTPKKAHHKTSLDLDYMPSLIVIHKSPSQERWFWMRAASTFKQKDSTEDSFNLTASADIDSELREALVDPEDGLLKPGGMPKVQCASAAGCKQLLDVMAKASLILWVVGGVRHINLISMKSFMFRI